MAEGIGDTLVSVGDANSAYVLNEPGEANPWDIAPGLDWTMRSDGMLGSRPCKLAR